MSMATMVSVGVKAEGLGRRDSEFPLKLHQKLSSLGVALYWRRSLISSLAQLVHPRAVNQYLGHYVTWSSIAFRLTACALPSASMPKINQLAGIGLDLTPKDHQCAAQRNESRTR